MLPRLLRPLLAAVYGVYATVVFCAVTLVVFCPLVIAAPTLPMRRALGRLGVRTGLLLMGVPFHVRGSEHLPAGPCIVVANHASYLDGLVLTAALPGRFTFVVQHGVASWPYAGLVLRRLQARFVNRSSARESAVQTRGLLKALRQGESLAIFAEGTFVATPGLMAFKNGAFLMASKTQVPVVPVGIRGTRRLFGEGRWLPRWSRVEIDICPAIAATHDAYAMRDAARREVLGVCGEHDAHAATPARAAAPAEAANDAAAPTAASRPGSA